MKKRYATLLLLALSLLSGCKMSQEAFRKSAEEKAMIFLKVNNLDSSATPKLPYNLEIPSQEIAWTQELLWQDWQKVNQEILEASQIAKPWSVNEKAYTLWSIPQGQKMKISLMTKEAKPTEGYPFLINLHGGGKNPYAKSAWDSEMNDSEWSAAYYLASKYAEGEPSYYFIPRMADDRIGRWYLAPQIETFQRAIKLAFLSGLINPYKTYLLGISEGGYGSHRLAMFMPDYFAGIGPMAAAEPFHYAENLRNVAFHMEVGEFDNGFGRNKLAAQWQKALDSLQKLSPEDFIHEVNIQAGKGHGVDYFKIVPRLLKAKRRVYPKHLSYTYHNMTPDYGETNYSQGVYYLDFRGLKPNKGSLKIDLKKSGNIYDIQLNNEGVTGYLGLYVDQFDWHKPVIVRVNGKVVIKKKVKAELSAMLSALSLWGDPLRLFPAKLKIQL